MAAWFMLQSTSVGRDTKTLQNGGPTITRFVASLRKPHPLSRSTLPESAGWRGASAPTLNAANNLPHMGSRQDNRLRSLQPSDLFRVQKTSFATVRHMSPCWDRSGS